MASACVNNTIAAAMDCPSSSSSSPFHWNLPSPRLSSFTLDTSSSSSTQNPPSSATDAPEIPDLEEEEEENGGSGDFEFQLHGPVNNTMMLPADQLFSDGKLVPLHRTTTTTTTTASVADSCSVLQEEAVVKLKSSEVAMSEAAAYLFSPKAPRCASRWRDLLGLKKSSIQQQQQGNITTTTTNNKLANNTTTNTTSSAVGTGKSSSSSSIRQFFHRSSKSASSVGDGASLSLIPLLKDSDCNSESVSVSSRLSLSSSYSGHDLDDIRRLSLDTTDKQPHHLILLRSNPNPNPPRVRLVKQQKPLIDHPTARVGHSPMRRVPQQDPTVSMAQQRGLALSADSPRMNSSGKIVFQGLERSSSSPSSFNGGGGGGGGGTRYKYRGMERSYSANVRVTPVLNVPVCSSLRGSSKSSSGGGGGGVFGFGQLFSSSVSLSSSLRKEASGGAGNGKGTHHHSHSHSHHQST